MKRRFPIWMRWVAGLLLLAILIVLGLWLARKPIAKAYAASWCEARELSCDFEIETLGLNKVEINNLRVSSKDTPNLITLGQGAATLSWPKLLNPSLAELALGAPSLKIDFDGTKITMDGLEQLAGSGTSGSAAAPQIDIKDGSVLLSTPAGTLQGSFSANGRLPQNGSIYAKLEPAELNSDGNTLSLQSGNLELTATASELTGNARLEVAAAQFGDLNASNLKINAELADASNQLIDWGAEAERLTIAGVLDTEALKTTGTVQLRDTGDNAETDLSDMLSAFTATGSSARFQMNDFGGRSTSFLTRFERAEASSLTGTIEARSLEIASHFGTAKDAAITWSGRFNPETNLLSGRGDLIVKDASLEKIFRQGLTGGIQQSGILKDHFDALRLALDQGLKQFSTAAAYEMSYAQNGDWKIAFPEDIEIKANSGLSVFLTASRAEGINLAPSGMTYSGLLAVNGGGAPSLNADIQNFTVALDQLALTTGGLTLTPWTENGVTLSGKLNRFKYANTSATTRAEALGEVSIDGTVLGLGLTDARVFGGVIALQGREGWRVQTSDQDCLGLDVASFRVGGTFTISGLAFPICPEDGRFIRQEDGYSTGRVTLGDVAFDIKGNDTSGRANFTNGVLSWSTEFGFQIDIQADTLDFPATIGQRTLRTISQSPRLSLQTQDQTFLSAGLGRTALSGSMVPANVSIDETRFSGRVTRAGLNGTAKSVGVRISDLNSDPIYQPLIAAFDARLDGADLSLSGPINLDRATPLPIANVRLDLDLIELNGTADVISRDLQFSRNGLQPRALSDRVRGIFSSGRGLLKGMANFTITKGKLAGTGEITAENFGFDTFRVGSVDGVSGTVRFDDIIGLSTPPGQQVSIQRVNPGIVLQNGTLIFQILGGREAVIESAAWPFAGGTLEVEPSNWTIAGIRDVLTINARNLELSKMIEELSLPDINATGTVSGSFPLELRGGQTIIKNARLVADAKGGTLKYTGNAVNQAAATDETVNAAFTALRDFRFKVLEIGVNGDLVSDIVVSLNLLGFNPEVLGGAEFKFNVAIDSKLAQLIKSGQDLSSSKIITETAVNEVRQNAATQP